jgi:hypothetical protein
MKKIIFFVNTIFTQYDGMRVILVRGESFVDRSVTRDNFVEMADMAVIKAFETY